MAKSTDYYDGPVCYVGDGAVAVTIDGEAAEPGWHYTAVVDEEAKKVALDHAQAQVALWEKRAKGRVTGRFAQANLAAAHQQLAEVQAASFEVPGEKLHLEDTEDGSQSRYRLAASSDERSWHDRKHTQLATIQMEDAAEATRLSPAEYDAAMRAVRELRDQEGGR